MIKKLVDKYIVDILQIYLKGKEKHFVNYTQSRIYFKTKDLIRLIKYSRGEKNEI